MFGMPEEFRTFLWFDVVEDLADSAPERFPGPGGGLPEPVLDLGECLLDRVRVRTVRRKGEHVRADCADPREHIRALARRRWSSFRHDGQSILKPAVIPLTPGAGPGS